MQYCRTMYGSCCRYHPSDRKIY